MNELLIHAITSKNLENIILKESRYKNGHTLFDAIYMKCPRWTKLQIKKVGDEGKREWKVTANGYRSSQTQHWYTYLHMRGKTTIVL